MNDVDNIRVELRKKIDEIKSDERYNYPAANVFVNAPLALIQVEMNAKVSAYEEALSLLGE